MLPGCAQGSRLPPSFLAGRRIGEGTTSRSTAARVSTSSYIYSGRAEVEQNSQFRFQRPSKRNRWKTSEETASCLVLTMAREALKEGRLSSFCLAALREVDCGWPRIPLLRPALVHSPRADFPSEGGTARRDSAREGRKSSEVRDSRL